MPSRTRVVSLFLFGSGFCALIYQTTWLREFRLIFGASTAASAAVLGVFMAGLGFGGIFLGRRPVGILYGINTLGAVSGALFGTFYLFENFGNHLTLWWATAVNFIVALAAFRFTKSMPESVVHEELFDKEDSGPAVSQLFVLV